MKQTFLFDWTTARASDVKTLARAARALWLRGDPERLHLLGRASAGTVSRTELQAKAAPGS